MCKDLLKRRPAEVKASSVSVHELGTNASQKDTLLDAAEHFHGLMPWRRLHMRVFTDVA